MPKYINAENLIKIFNAKAEMASGTPKQVFFSAANMVEKLPAADVQEVVKCEHCVYWDHGKCEGIRNGLIMEYTKPFDYCSYGKLMDEEEII